MNFDFKKLMTTRFLFTAGVEMQAVIMGWQMYLLTHDALHLGLIGLAEAVPALGLAMFAGYIVDRTKPLKVYKWVLYVSLFSGLVVLVTQSTLVTLSSSSQVIALYAASFISGVARGFSQPAMFSIVPRIVSRNELPKASAWMSSIMQVARIGGPAVGGILLELGGDVTAVSFVVVLSLLVGVASLHLIQADPASNPLARSSTAHFKTELLSGAKFVFSHKLLFPALTLDMVSVLFGGVTALLPIYVHEILNVQGGGFGLLRASPAIGAALVGFWMTKGKIREKAGAWLFACVGAFGLCNLVFAVSKSYWLSFAALLLGGGFDSVSAIIRGSAVQLVSPDHMRGRIAAINAMFIGSSNELGEFESGVAAKFMGTVQSAVFGAVVCLVTVGTMFVVAPALRRLNLRELEETGDPTIAS